MDSDYDKRLEAEIDEMLKGLPDLKAPERLLAGVMSRTARHASVPWYRQSWGMWPAGLRYAALAFMMASFGALCFTSFELTRAAGFSTAAQEVGNAFSGINTLWNALNAVLGGLVLAVKQIHPFILFGCIALLGIGWSACVALGTAFVRFTVVRK